MAETDRRRTEAPAGETKAMNWAKERAHPIVRPLKTLIGHGLEPEEYDEIWDRHNKATGMPPPCSPKLSIPPVMPGRVRDCRGLRL